METGSEGPAGGPSRPSRDETDPAQAWFWTEAWRAGAGERRASEDIRRGRTRAFETTEDFLASVDE